MTIVKASQTVATRDISDIVVLIVEDEIDLRDTVVTLLEQLGCRVISAEDTDSALLIIRSDAAIDLLFSDVITPGSCTGVELAEYAMAQRPALKVLLTTGYSDDPDRMASHFAPWPVISKPYQRGALIRAFNDVLGISDPVA